MISQHQYIQMLTRTQPRSSGGKDLPDEHEAGLHDQILSFCKNRGWIPFHGSMAHKTHRVAGEPDFLILADNGKLIAVECKSRHGKISTAQLGIITWAQKLGHTVHVISSFKEFLKIAETYQTDESLRKVEALFL